MPASNITEGSTKLDGLQETSSPTAKRVQHTATRLDAGYAFKGWKPLTLRLWILMPFALCNALLIAVLEYLHYLDSRDGGLFLSYDTFSNTVGFLYLYLPTMIAVCLSLIWSWIDLDAKRLEPFFQLSKSHGAAINNSLTLDCPFEYIALVPFKALRRGHWSVVAVSFNTLFIFWIATPLFSAIFTVTSIPSQRNETGLSVANLLPVSHQVSALTSQFLLDAYCVVWLGQALPAFVSSDSALLPFTVDAKNALVLANETWESTTTAYSTSLSCELAKENFSSNIIYYSDSRGCAVPYDYACLSSSYWQKSASYLGYYGEQLHNGWQPPLSEDYNLCVSPQYSHMFLTGLCQSFNSSSTVAASSLLSCEASYWHTQVRVRVHAVNQSVIDIQPLAPAKPLKEDLFNITNFEYILSTGSPKQSRRADRWDSLRSIDQQSRMVAFGIQWTSNVFGVAVGASQQQPEKYMNTTILASALEKAHKLLFALAAQSLIKNTNTDLQREPIIVRGTARSVTMIGSLVIAAQVSLGLILTFTIIVIFLNCERRTQLRSDPSCLEDILKMIECSGQSSIYAKARSNGCCTARLDKGILKIEECAGKDHAYSASPLPQPQDKRWQGTSGSDDLVTSRTQRPWEMDSLTGVFLQLTLIIALAILVAIKILQERNNGLQALSGPSVWTQIITSYFPVIFATLLEPFCKLLNRALCVVQPFHALRNSMTQPSNSIRLKYTSLPPPLVIMRALKARHYILAIVCLTGISTNILTVAMGALLHTSSTQVEKEIVLRSKLVPIINAGYINFSISEEYFYVAKVNLTGGIVLPPWTGKNNFFLPVTLPQEIDAGLDSFVKVNTTGFGTTLACQEVTVDADRYVSNPSEQRLTFRVKGTEKESLCMQSWAGLVGGQNKSESAAEILRPLGSDLLSPDSDSCAPNLMAALLRGNLTSSRDVFRTDFNDNGTESNSEILSINSLSSIWMICKPTFVAAPFEVTVDPNGHIQQATRTGNISSDASNYFAAGLDAKTFLGITSRIWSGSDTYWHNDTFVDSWFGCMIKAITNSTELVDPKKQLPTFQAIAPVVEEIYSRIFAIIMASNTDWFQAAPPETVVPGILITVDERLWISKPAFLVSVILLSLNIVVAGVYYVKRPKKMPRYMPKTILDILELFDGSGLVQDVLKDGTVGENSKLMYGKFIGTNGRPHLGIDRMPYVVP